MVLAEKAERLLQSLLDALSDLERYRQSVTREVLRADRDTQNMVLHALYVAIQSAIDLAFHAVADAGLPRPATYQDAFRRLSEGGRLEPELAERLAGWAGLRNVLAHFYPVIDFDKVHQALRDGLADLRTFARTMAALVPPAGP